MIKLPKFWRWRDPNHSFVELHKDVDKTLIKDIRQLCFKFIPEALLRRVFEYINTSFKTKQPTNHELSVMLQTELKVKFNLSPV